jgi:nucleoid DNA-binding protein
MDIDLLSKMVKEMILDNDSVTLPGIGSFVAEVVPATFSDKGYTINPPYRRLFFRQRHQDDSRLIDFYCQSNGVAPADGKRILTEFLAGLKEILIEKKNVILPGLGRLRATKENNFFFVPDEDLDIYPNGYGLEPISLKTHQETEEEVSAAIAGLRSIIEEPVEEPVVVPEPEPVTEPEPAVEPEPIDISLPDEEPIVEVAPEPETPVEPAAEEPVEQAPETPVEPVAVEPAPAEPEAPVKEKAPRNPWITLGLVLGALLLAVALFLLIFVILAKVDPEFIDSILYSPEELRIINY